MSIELKYINLQKLPLRNTIDKTLNGPIKQAINYFKIAHVIR
jgi:hypothetical protein